MGGGNLTLDIIEARGLGPMPRPHGGSGGRSTQIIQYS